MTRSILGALIRSDHASTAAFTTGGLGGGGGLPGGPETVPFVDQNSLFATPSSLATVAWNCSATGLLECIASKTLPPPSTNALKTSRSAAGSAHAAWFEN